MARGPRHFAYPMRFTARGFATVEQDTEDDIAMCCAVILAYPLGGREERPDFGTPEQAFAGPDLIELRQSIAAWEPRAHTTVEMDDADLLTLVAHVRILAGGVE